jgi:hypothetical protein
MNNAERVHAAQCLRSALGLIDSEDKWARNAHAKLEDGSICPWWNWKAKQFSIYGAIRRCCNLTGEFTYVCSVITAMIFTDLVSWNDDPDTTYEMVINVLDSSIDYILPEEKEEIIANILVTKKMKNDWKHDKIMAQELPSPEMIYWLGYSRGTGKGVIGENNGL